METISRRSVMGIAASVLAGGVLAAETTSVGGSEEKQKPGASELAGGESEYKYSMKDAPARHYGESSVREHKLDDFPASTSMSATLITLAPGDLREPHWHPNSDEWLFVMAGEVRMTIVDGHGKASQFNCGLEDVSFTPIGFGHYVENIGDSEAKLMLVHNHAEFTTVNLSEWVAGGPASVFASTLKIPVQAFDNAPTKKVFIRTKDGKA